MILTDEELLATICGHIPPQNVDNMVVQDIIKDGRAIESAVLRKLRERPADAVLLTYDSGERELRFQNNGWPAAETPLHIIPEVNE